MTAAVSQRRRSQWPAQRGRRVVVPGMDVVDRIQKGPGGAKRHGPIDPGASGGPMLSDEAFREASKAGRLGDARAQPLSQQLPANALTTRTGIFQGGGKRRDALPK